MVVKTAVTGMGIRLILSLAWWFGLGAHCSAFAQDIKYAADPNASKNMTLLLKDFDPKPMLHVPVHEIARAKFPVIDVHNHVNDPGGIHGEEIPAAEVVRRMDQMNVQKIVILTGQWGEKLQGLIDKMVKPYPQRVVVFAQIDYQDIDEPGFTAKQVAQLDDAVRRGARGLKVLKDLGLGDRDKQGSLIRIDDPRLDVPRRLLSLRRGDRLRHRVRWSASADGRDEFRIPDHRAVFRSSCLRAVLVLGAGRRPFGEGYDP